ncbi:flagellar protein FlgN [Erythrobacter insulae]|uniref:Flagellar protein FlgN n=1 Tax=Erythrobacter insulae TaxID=2584124 RepID=A0A547PAC4_9SPHN|nr:flagellar protein FlgN [Erythrobacter insulae]TRD11086.1 flagellar protein FlgN [Erythrobacter insulae]
MTHDLSGNLRQMIAVLERERQALASLDADELVCTARDKEALCEALSPVAPDALDNETRTLAETARQLNAVNRRVRNLLAANVAARIDALSGRPGTHRQATFAHA